ncbi:MAG TPA: aminopeptidase [Solirubrobacteraceae bacterium]|nr:aminopeptidase [Solirubrobacteraceae bacterium]
MSDEQRYLEALVELAVGFGAEVQPDQIVMVLAETGLEAYARAAARHAYRRGARYVDVEYFDPHVKHARLAHAAKESLSYRPPWIGERILQGGEHHAAKIWFYGDTAPDLMSDIDPERLGLDMSPRHRESIQVTSARQCNWTIVPAVTPAWARSVFDDRTEPEAITAMWKTIAHVCRLGEPDPVAAWTQRFATLKAVARRLDALDLDVLRFQGPGTDLTIGLLPGSRFIAAEMETVWGQLHHPNLPSEEVFTTPDPERTQGYVTATRPLLVPGAAPVTGLRVHFEHGRAVRFDSDSGGGVLEAQANRDDGGRRLGEVALVDRESRVGQAGKVFHNILLDENAASHIALGNGYPMALADEASRERMNRSEIHVDFMIGSDEVDVTGVTRGGETRPLLRGGAWQI